MKKEFTRLNFSISDRVEEFVRDKEEMTGEMVNQINMHEFNIYEFDRLLDEFFEE
ncbi:Uncharacterised protein [[Flavobacterium] thermophilum]|nr:Uncharacterised protein [[Flavobacterium] thermophilum]